MIGTANPCHGTESLAVKGNKIRKDLHITE